MRTNSLSSWQIVSASVRGTSHKSFGYPCQDTHDYQQLPGSILVAAVADGAGSSSYAEIGSEIATRIAVSEATSRLSKDSSCETDDWQSFWTDILELIRAEIQVAAELRQVEVRELATTLILIAATPKWISVAQIGDGAIVVRDRQGAVIGLTTPPAGEYPNETNFLTSPSALDDIQFRLWHGEPAQVAVFSDGLQRLALKMPEGIPHQPFFAPLFDFVAQVTDEQEATDQLLKFLESPRIAERADDDLTLLLANLPFV